MSVWMAVAGLVAVAIILAGLSALILRRGRPLPSLPFYAGGIAALLLLMVATVTQSEAVESFPPLFRSALEVLAWLGASFFIFTVLDAVIIGEWLIERGKRYIPDVVRHLLIGAEVVAAGVLILWLVMGVNLVALVALPTVAAAMVGVALKDTLTRFFSGIELGKIVKVGDWIAVADREGIVTHIGMEHVTLLTRTQDVVCLPNDLVIQNGVTNFSRPSQLHLRSVYVEAAYRATPELVCAVLEEAASSVPGVATEPRPIAMVTAFNESGIQYRIKFPILDYGQYPVIESRVRTYIWHVFSRRGIEIPFPQRVVHQMVAPESEPPEESLERIVQQLTGDDFLAMLDPKQLSLLAQGSRKETYLPGERVVRQGEAGDVLYVVVAGQADVRVETERLSKTVATIGAGQFFGEMSLLTGEPRSATVAATTGLEVIAVGKAALMRVVEADHRLLDRIGEIVARRQAVTMSAKAQLSQEAASLSAATHTRSLIERIQTFFWGKKRAPLP